MSMWTQFRWTKAHLPAVVKPAIAFEFWSTLIFVASFVPASGWLLNRLVASSGQYAVSDTDILAFLFSLPGVLFFLLSIGFVLAFWFAEQAALLVIVLHGIRGKKIAVSRLLWENIKHLPALLRLGLRQAVIYLVAAIPLGGGIGLTYWLLLGEWDFYYYLNVQPPSWWIAVSIVATLCAVYLAVAAWLSIRWLLAIPALLFEKLSHIEAMRKSWHQTRGRFRELALPLATTWIVVLLASGVMSWLIGIVAAFLLTETATLKLLIPLVAGTLALLAISDLLWFMTGKITHVMLMTRAYLDTTDLEHLAVETDAAAGTPLPAGLIRTGWVVACVVLLITGIAGGIGFVQGLSIERKLEITGHRASKRRAPENTLSALRQAIVEGADSAEIDVQTTADGVVVLLHDADLMRVASVNRHLHEINSEQLQDIDVGSWFDPEFSSERIPTLQEVIDLARDQIKLNIELKYTWPDPDLAQKVGQIVRDNDFVSQCVVSSLSFDALEEIQQRFPELTTGFIVFQAIGDLPRMDVDFLSISAARATPALVRTVHRRGGEVHVWTVNDPSNTLSMIEMGVDNIITDEPELIRRVLEEWNTLSNSEKLALMLRNLIVGLEPPEPSEL